MIDLYILKHQKSKKANIENKKQINLVINCLGNTRIGSELLLSHKKPVDEILERSEEKIK